MKQTDSRIAVAVEDGRLAVKLRGEWSLERAVPSWRQLLSETAGIRNGSEIREMVVDGSDLSVWDSSVFLFLLQIRDDARERGVPCRMQHVPGLLRQLMEQREKSAAAAPAPLRSKRAEGRFERLGEAVLRGGSGALEWFGFAGECILGIGRVCVRRSRFRWRDAFWNMQQCGAMALPIVGLISFLVGLILAYQAAIQMRYYGAEIFVANLVGLSVVREMGPIMAAVILAGRTGASFAAQIGNMRMNDEVDALETLGIHPVDFLVLPRLVALSVMMPLLTVYANLLGVFGGYVVSTGILDIAPSAYWSQTRGAIGLSDLAVGLIKSLFFGAIIAASGCLRGLQCERSSEGVGRAATSAVVTALLLIIVLDAAFAVLFDKWGM